MIPSGAEVALRWSSTLPPTHNSRAGHPRVLDFVAAAEIVFLPTIVLGESKAGFQLGRRERENHVLLAEFLAEPFVSILPVTFDDHFDKAPSVDRTVLPVPNQSSRS